MAPTTEATGRKGKVTATNDEFLAVCFKNLKEKPAVDFNAVARDLGLSVGGAQ